MVIDDQAPVSPVRSAEAPSQGSLKQRGIAARWAGLPSGDAPVSPSASDRRTKFKSEAPANFQQVCFLFGGGGEQRQTSMTLYREPEHLALSSVEVFEREQQNNFRFF